MSNQNLIIYDFENLFNILDEIKDTFNYKIINVKKNMNILDYNNSLNYLVITKKHISFTTINFTSSKV